MKYQAGRMQMVVEFLGHAGFLVKAGGLNILIDPWLTPSSFESPVLSSFVPGHTTIDFMIPEPTRSKESLEPDIILLSHYHTHHSPAIDLNFWLEKSTKPISIIGFDLNPQIRHDFFESFSTKYPNHHFLTTNCDTKWQFGDVSIRALTHATNFHLSFFVEYNSTSFLHIADAQINRFWFDRRLDPIWHKFSMLHPTFLAISIATTSVRYFEKTENTPLLQENACMSPVEGANLTKIICPKFAAVMGVFNFSIWKNRTEYSFPATENEAYFRWAVQHLDKTIHVLPIRPGMCLNLTNNINSSVTFEP